MIILTRRWLARLRFALLFVVLTFLMYHLVMIVSGLVDPIQRQKTPHGHSVKVFSSSATLSDHVTMGERLKLFYWIGE